MATCAKCLKPVDISAILDILLKKSNISAILDILDILWQLVLKAETRLIYPLF